MLINELSFAKKQELARKLRKVIEPEKAQSKHIIKETVIRKYLSKEHLTYYGLFDLISVFKTNYSKKTISRLVSKIQKSIVWDTCLCHISSQELTDLLFNSDYGNIITRSVYDELLKLSLTKNDDPESSENAYRLITNILEDTESNFCSIIDLPPKMLNNKYVDNQLLIYCMQNNYTLYTHDYVLGLRAKSRSINVKIFTNFDETKIEQYTPTSTGKNILLDCSLLNEVSLSDILSRAKSIKGNKFLLTKNFIESLEPNLIKKNNRDLINFFVLDSDNTYTMYLPENETTNLTELVEKYNAIVFSPSIEQCITYKNFFIPYKIVYPADTVTFKRNILTTLKASPYSGNINISESDLVEPVSETGLANSNDSLSDICLTKNAVQKNTQLFMPPHYVVQSHQVNVAKVAPNERMWVLDETGADITSGKVSKIPLHVFSSIVHIENSLNDSYKLNVYKVVNRKAKCCMKTVSLTFSKETIEACVPQEFQSFARISVQLT